MKPKVLLTASIVAGVLALIFVQLYLRNQTGERVVVYRTTDSIKAGEAIGTRFKQVTLPGDRLFPNILEEAPGLGMENFITKTPAREALREGELILYRHLSNTVDPGVQAKIPPDMKALSIDVDESTAVSFMVQPEDLVDVIATIPNTTAMNSGGLLAGESGARQAGLVNKPVLQAVRVLAVGGRYRRTAPERREGYSSVTLLLTLEEAQKLIYVRDVLAARMTLVLRGPEDSERQANVRPFSIDSPDFDLVGNQAP